MTQPEQLTPPPAEDGPTLPRARWMRPLREATQGTRWRLALRELLILVATVLAALVAHAWWEERRERTRERDSLRKLLANETREFRGVIEAEQVPGAAR